MFIHWPGQCTTEGSSFNKEGSAVTNELLCIPSHGKCNDGAEEEEPGCKKRGASVTFQLLGEKRRAARKGAQLYYKARKVGVDFRQEKHELHARMRSSKGRA